MPGPCVGEDDPDARCGGRSSTRLHLDRAAAAVDQGVAGQLARGRDQLGLVDQGELDRHRDGPDQLADPDDVLVGGDRRGVRRSMARGHGAGSSRSSGRPSSSASELVESSPRVRASSSMPSSTLSAVRMPGQRQPQLDQGDRHRRPHADDDRLGVQHPGDRRDGGQRPADERVDDVQRR